MKIYFISMISLLLLVGCAQHVSQIETAPQLNSLHVIDRNGLTEVISTPDRLKNYANVDFMQTQNFEKVLRVYARDAQGDIYAYVTSYHSNGQVKQYLEVVNNRAFGVYKEWYPNGFLKVEAQLAGGEPDITTAAEKSWIFDGVCKAWDENGHLEAEIAYQKGQLHGPAHYYHSNGSLWKQIPYCFGLADGVEEVYLDNGELFTQTIYEKGLKNGLSFRYWNSNQVASEEQYVDGKLMAAQYFTQDRKLTSTIEQGEGYRTVFDKDGIAELQQYQKGEMQGKMQRFSTLGQLVCCYHIKNGMKHGEEIQYYLQRTFSEPLKPKLSINWHEGKIQGIVKTWYENGVQESQKEFTKNEKNGLLTAWFQDGSLMMIEEYDKGKLLKGSYYQRGEKIAVSQVNNQKGIATLYDSEGNFLRKVQYQFGKPVA